MDLWYLYTHRSSNNKLESMRRCGCIQRLSVGRLSVEHPVHASTITDQANRSFNSVFTLVCDIHVHLPVRSHRQPNVVRIGGEGILFVCVHGHVLCVMSAIHLSEQFNEGASVGLRPANVQKDEQEDLSSVLGKFFWKIEIIHTWNGKGDASQRTISVKRQWVPGPRGK